MRCDRRTTAALGVTAGVTQASLALALLLGGGARLASAQTCSLPELCTGSLTTGGCGFSGAANCTPPPSGPPGSTCSSSGVGGCSGVYNCVPPTVNNLGVQVLPGAGGTFTARLTLDVVAPFNNWASTNSPNGTATVLWYNQATVPDICASATTSLCNMFNTDHAQYWLDETGLTCDGAPYSFTVSALVSSCQQPSCFCEQVFGNPNCLCNASTATTLNGLQIQVPKSRIPGCGPPPYFCSEGGGVSGGGAAGAAASGSTLAAQGAKGNGPGSGAAGSNGAAGSQCQTCKSLPSSAGDGSGCSVSAGGGGPSCEMKGPGLSIGSSWSFFYDTTHAGYLDQVLLTDCHNSSRVDAAFSYDATGNVTAAWRGDPSLAGPDATDAVQMSFDNPTLPGVTTLQTLIRRTVVGGVDQDVWQTALYTLGRDPGRRGAAGTGKPRILQVTGECPSSGTTANPAFTYGDPANPMLPTTVIDGNGVSTAYTYDANGRTLTRVETVATSPTLVQRQTTWTYNAAFPAFVASVTGPFSPPGAAPAGTRSATMTYDAKGNLQTRTISGHETTFAGGAFSLATAYSGYSSAGLPGLIDPPDTPSTTTDATSYTFQAGSTDGYLIATRHDPVIGAPPLNAATTFAYDAWNRATDVTDPNGMRIHTTYDALNRVVSVTQGFGSAQPLTTTNRYDTLGDLVCVQLPAGNALAYTYDFAGRLTGIARQTSCTAAPFEQTIYALDAVGHRIQELRQRIVGGSPITDATTTYSYSTTCHLDSMTTGDPAQPSLQSTTEFAYDCNNNLQSLWDPNHNQPAPPTTSYSYDPLYRLTQVIQPWGGPSGGTAVTAYAYDLQDHLAAVTDAERNQTTYTTSDRDLLTRQVSPVTGTTSYAYNPHGALVQQTDARGVVTTRHLDPADRPTSVTYSTDTSLTTAYTYDTTAATGTSPIGRLAAIAKGSGAAATTIGYTYDLFGRMLQDGALAYTYDANGNRASITYPGPLTACYAYDAADRQAALAYSTAAGTNPCLGTTVPLVTTTSGAPTVYLAGGPLQTVHLGNGLVETHTYDQRTYPTAITAGAALAWTYATDAVGNITAITPGRTYAYQDYQYFLTQANAPTLWGTRTWTYDTLGNRLTENRGTGTADTYTYQANTASPQGDTPKLTAIALAAGGSEYLTTDPAGNAIQQATPTANLDLTTDAAGKLAHLADDVQSTAATLAYDGRGFLAAASNPATACGPLVTLPTYGSEGLLYARTQHALFTGALQSQTRILYFAGRPLAQLDGPLTTPTLTYLTTDHLGTPILTTTPTALPTWSGGFEPFGRDYTTPSARSTGLFLRLPGQWDDPTWDAATSGLYYNVNRWYQSDRGRFSQPDPLNRAKLPLFIYAEGKPTGFIDMLGLDSTLPTGNASGDACCAEALARDLFSHTDEMSKTGGIVVCCNGTKVPCVVQRDNSFSPPVQRAYALALQCVKQHEQSHILDLPDCPTCDVGPQPVVQPGFPTGAQRGASECKAYGVTISCLEQAKGQCGGNSACLTALEVLLKDSTEARGRFGCH